jgi:hypothetical protein
MGSNGETKSDCDKESWKEEEETLRKMQREFLQNSKQMGKVPRGDRRGQTGHVREKLRGQSSTLAHHKPAQEDQSEIPETRESSSTSNADK